MSSAERMSFPLCVSEQSARMFPFGSTVSFTWCTSDALRSALLAAPTSRSRCDGAGTACSYRSRALRLTLRALPHSPAP